MAGTETLPGLNDATVGTDYSVTSGDLTSYFPQGSTATIDLSAGSAGTLQFLWGASGSGCLASALLITVYSDDGSSNYSSRYVGVNPAAACASRGQGFLEAGSGGTDYNSSYSLDYTANDKLVRIKVLYAGTTMSVSGAGVQQYTAQAMATGDTDGVTSAIQGTRSIPAAPAIFDYALYSGGSIVKAN